jgi:hypothetical protein
MSEPSTHAIDGLEATLRDAAMRAMKPGMPLPLALGFFRAVIGLARTLRQYREVAGLPPELSNDLVLVLGSVRNCANRRFYEAGLTEALGLRVLSAYTGLARAVLAAMPPPEKAKKPAAPRKSAPVLLPPALPALPRRKNEYDNIGAIAVRAMDAMMPRDPLLAHALRKAAGAKFAA